MCFSTGNYGLKNKEESLQVKVLRFLPLASIQDGHQAQKFQFQSVLFHQQKLPVHTVGAQL